MWTERRPGAELFVVTGEGVDKVRWATGEKEVRSEVAWVIPTPTPSPTPVTLLGLADFSGLPSPGQWEGPPWVRRGLSEL